VEAEDVLLQLDRTLADLFSYIHKSVGLEHTLIVLSADHGAPEALPYLNRRGDRNAHYFDMNACLQSVESGLDKEKYNGVQGLVGEYAHPYIYLDHALLKQEGLDRVAVSEVVATLLRECPGVSTAVTARDTQYATDRNRLVESRVWHNYNARRSGDVYIVLDSNVYVNDFDGLTVASSHGSPWNYDTFVPIFFAGHGIEPASVNRPVTPYDIAPTLSARLGIKPPSGTVGEPLSEVVE
jgi:arylsulfatase A-like enzyme